MRDDQQQKELVGTARITGVWYLMLAITGMVGFLMLHSRIYVAGDPSKTLANLTEHETLARMRLLFEFLIVVSQALVAVWFYKLFKDIRHVAAWSLAAWGMMNSVATATVGEFWMIAYLLIFGIWPVLESPGNHSN